MSWPNDLDVTETLVRARIHAEGLMAAELAITGLSDTLSCPWSETTVTDVFAQQLVSNTIRVVRPNQVEEATIGADILWWFVDQISDEAFGILCQAKNLKRTRSGSMMIDVAYKNEAQLDALLQSGDALGVPTAILIYGGPPSYRQDLGIEKATSQELAVSLIPSFAVAKHLSNGNRGTVLAKSLLELAQPVEQLFVPFEKELAFPELVQINPMRKDHEISEDLRREIEEFIRLLRESQEGVRTMTRHLLRMVLSIAEFSVLPSPRTARLQLPLRVDHVVRGLRPKPPDYLDVVNGTVREQVLSHEQLSALANTSIWLTTIG